MDNHFTTLKLIRNNFVACNLPPDGRSSSERGQQVAGSNPPAKNNAGRQLAIELLWPKPTDFITGPAFEAFEERHDSATFPETDERGCLKIWSNLARKGQAWWTFVCKTGRAC